MTNNFDAIVVGAGMSGSWAAKEFSEQGFKTLLLERGPNVEHNKDYPTTNMQPWEFKHRGQLTAQEIQENPARNHIPGRLLVAIFFVWRRSGSRVHPRSS